MSTKQAYVQALEWYLDQGVDEVLGDDCVNYYALQEQKMAELMRPPEPVVSGDVGGSAAMTSSPAPVATSVPEMGADAASAAALGAAEAKAQALKLAQEAGTLEALKEAIAEFDGIALKKTASNMVFADGNPEAKIMLVGEAPGAEEDREGKPFVGPCGHLLDKILASIGLARDAEDLKNAVYLTNVLNWRPPGNRSPSPGEVEASLPFIEKHIQLVKPEILIFCGGVSAKSLLGRSEGISRLRKTWHAYKPQCAELQNDAAEIKALATFHPSYLLKTPAQKRAVWHDMLMLKKEI